MNAPKLRAVTDENKDEFVTEGISPAVAPGGSGPHDPGMDTRITKLEGSYDALKVVRPMTIAVISIFLAVVALSYAIVIGQLARVDSRLDALSAKVDAIPQRLTEEFRAMRAEMAGQTSAIANSITATKQTPPQVIVLPAPTQSPLVPPQQTPSPPRHWTEAQHHNKGGILALNLFLGWTLIGWVGALLRRSDRPGSNDLALLREGASYGLGYHLA
jgi:hypothetical protein